MEPRLLAVTGPSAALVVDLMVIMVAASVVSMVLRRLRLAAIPGYLIAGAVLGPGAANLVAGASIGPISDLAIVLLLFTIGLHMDLDWVRTGMVRVIAVGVTSTAAVVALGWPTAMVFGVAAPAGLVIAAALAMSSTAVVMGLLQQRREVHLVHGRLCVGIELVQDLISVGVLALLPSIAAWAGAGPAQGEEPAAVERGTVLRLVAGGALAISAIALMLVLGRLLLPRLLREAARGAPVDSLVVLVTAVALGAAGLTTLLGVGPALGAFLAGLMLASTPFRHQVSGQFVPLRELFMAVFFTALGLRLDVPEVAQSWWVVLAIVAVLIAIKGVVIAASAWAGGATAPIAAFAGLALAQAGEFSLVILAAASDRRIISHDELTVLIGAVVVSLMLTPPLFSLAHAVRPRVARMPTAGWVRRGPAAEGGEGSAGAGGGKHVIIAGFGVVGRNLAEHFAARAIPFTVIELNADTVRRQLALGRSVVFGDVTNAEVLARAGVKDAEAVILTIPDDDATLRACQLIRSLAPGVFIAARTSFLSRAFVATQLGADHVTVEELATARDMAEQVMRHLGARAVGH